MAQPWNGTNADVLSTKSDRLLSGTSSEQANPRADATSPSRVMSSSSLPLLDTAGYPSDFHSQSTPQLYGGIPEITGHPVQLSPERMDHEPDSLPSSPVKLPPQQIGYPQLFEAKDLETRSSERATASAQTPMSSEVCSWHAIHIVLIFACHAMCF